ncbi:hypothetical protein ACH4TV_29915 [Streptomyces sp. NPDC020898]|uniref:hypothetical protein n=1 Tax=Streptomyces sp. NPDC020898 TaxID=3365101 RepID=UPI0037B40004
MAALRCADMSGMATAVPDAAYHQWCEALTWLRLGLCDRLLDIVLAHLSERSFDGEPLLRQQLLKGSLADVEIERLELLSVLATTASGSWELPTLAVLHERITDNARTLLHLCGAHGFTLEEPGVLAYTSELLSDVYLGTCDVGAAI